MKRAFALALALATPAIAGCASGGDTRGAGDSATPAPGVAFRDGLLYAAVKARLAGMDIDSATRISVRVNDGAVVLTGTVADAATKERDAQIVRGMRGVKHVDDRLRVGPVGPSTAQVVGDAALTAAVTSGLAAQAGINVAAIRVRSRAGTVTLSGRAPTTAIRSTLVDAAKKTPGVRNVVDRIEVR